MVLFRGLVLFLLLTVACVAAPTSPRMKTSDPEVARRWYSVPDDRGILSNSYRAWPPSDDGSRTIHSCFMDVHTYDTIGAMFELALAKWAPAIRVSSLNFAPDPACPEKPYLCTEPHVAAEKTLHIMLRDVKELALSSFGYKPPFVELENPTMPRHYLQWATHAASIGPEGSLHMAHELGGYFARQPRNRNTSAPC
jgi:hypothetical protein